MLRWVQNMSISTRTSIMALMGYMFFGAAIMLVTYLTLNAHQVLSAQKQVNTQSVMARALLEARFGTKYEVRDNTLYLGEHPLNGDINTIDTIADLIGGGAMTIFLGDVRIVTNLTNPENGARLVRTSLNKGAAYDSVFKDKKPYYAENILFGEPYLTVYDPIFDEQGQVIGIFFVGHKKSAEMALVLSIVRRVSFGTLVLGLLMSLVTYFAIRFQMKPLVDLEHVMERLAQDDVDVEVPAKNRSDEIGLMSHAVETFRGSIIEKMALREEQARQKEKAELARRELMERLANDFQDKIGAVVDNVARASVDMKASAETMNESVQVSQKQAARVSGAAQKASDNIGHIVQASNEMGEAINSINRQIEESSRVAARCMSEAEETGLFMGKLSKASEDIDAVVQLIEGIAHQVNLLALNATIEAARAGEAGKGFAVVAGEVKTLANRASAATKEITSHIEGIQEQTRHAVSTISSVTETIRHINEISRTIADAVEGQNRATQEISSGIFDTSESARTVTNNIDGVTQSTQEVEATSQHVLETAERLAQESDTLRVSVEGLIAHIRSA